MEVETKFAKFKLNSRFSRINAELSTLSLKSLVKKKEPVCILERVCTLSHSYYPTLDRFLLFSFEIGCKFFLDSSSLTLQLFIGNAISFAYALYVSLSVQTLGVFGELWLTTRNSMANAPYQGTHKPVNRSTRDL